MKHIKGKEGDRYFESVLKILNKNKINYWLDQGSLLGIYRDKKLLDWEWDIDFGVFAGETNKDDLIELFVKEGFKLEMIPEDNSSIHFLKGKHRKADFTFYNKENGYAKAVYYSMSSGIMKKMIYMYFVHLKYDKRYYMSFSKVESISSFIKYILSKFVLIYKFLLPNKRRNKIVSKLENYIRESKFLTAHPLSVPQEYFNSKNKISFNDEYINVPESTENCLRLYYGNDWHIPKKDWVWHEDRYKVKRD